MVSYRTATWCSEVLWGAIWPCAGAMWCYGVLWGAMQQGPVLSHAIERGGSLWCYLCYRGFIWLYTQCFFP